MTSLFDTKADLVSTLKMLHGYADDYRKIGLTGEMPPLLRRVVLEYKRLASCRKSTKEDSSRLGLLFMAAQRNRLLGFWFAEIDHIVAHEQGHLSRALRDSYQDEHAMLSEYLGLDVKFPVVHDVSCTLPISDPFDTRSMVRFKQFLEQEMYVDNYVI
jgi:hypothetical protein